MMYANDINGKFIHKKSTTTKNGKNRNFYSVSFPCSKSVSGYGSITVNPQDRIKGKTEGYWNIRLGEDSKSHSVNIFNGTGYENIRMTSAEIMAEIKNARIAATNKAKAKAMATA